MAPPGLTTKRFQPLFHHSHPHPKGTSLDIGQRILTFSATTQGKFIGRPLRTPDPWYLEMISLLSKKKKTTYMQRIQLRLTDDGDGVSQQVASGDLVESSQVGESGSTDLAAVGSLTAVTDNEDTHLTLGGLNGRVCLARGNSITLGEEKEVVDESLHVLLHGRTGRRRELVVLNLNGTRRHLVQTLVDDTERLTELLHTAQVTVVAVTVDTNGDIELHIAVGVIRLRLPDIPGDTGTTEHNSSETHIEGIRGTDNANTLGSRLPDPVIRQQFLGLVDTVTELSSPLVDVVKEAERNILRNSTRANVGGVKTGTGDTLVEFLLIAKMVR